MQQTKGSDYKVFLIQILIRAYTSWRSLIDSVEDSLSIDAPSLFMSANCISGFDFTFILYSMRSGLSSSSSFCNSSMSISKY